MKKIITICCFTLLMGCNSSTSQNSNRNNLELNQKRFEAGQISEFDFQIAKNTYQLANQNYIVAKYNYVFNQLVLDYYAGLELSL